jgi:hypothetical protein
LPAHIQAQIRYQVQCAGVSRGTEYSANRNGGRPIENTPKINAQSAT